MPRKRLRGKEQTLRLARVFERRVELTSYPALLGLVRSVKEKWCVHVQGVKLRSRVRTYRILN